MEKELLMNKVIEKLKKIGGKGCIVMGQKILKENGTGYMGIMIRRPGAATAPIINWDKMYEELGERLSVKALAYQIYLYTENEPVLFEEADLMDYETVKERLRFRIVNLERNKDLLKQIPYEGFLDLAVIFYLLAGSIEKGDMIITVTNALLEKWNISYEELKEQAMENCEKCLPARFTSIEHMLFGSDKWDDTELFPDRLTDKGEIPLYCLTNKSGRSGAAVLLYPEVLPKVSRLLDSDLVILPSSRHEVLVCPYNELDLGSLREIVQAVNREEVAPEDQLSDQVYVFRRESGKLELGAA